MRAVDQRYGANDDRRYIAQGQPAYGAPPDGGYAPPGPAYPTQQAQTYPAQPQAYDYHRRGDERLFEAQVTQVRAVVGPADQRCWVERRELGGANIPGAIVGGVIGGVLGHQIGGGRGQDVATIGGAVAGAAIGGNVGRDSEYGRDVQHCTDSARYDRPDYWDVTYVFDGLEHRVQMSNPPGATITVNRAGEPRV